MKTQYDPAGYPFSTNMNKQTIEQIEESIKALEELKKTLVGIYLTMANAPQVENEPWKPAKGDEYWYYSDNHIGTYTWGDWDADEMRLEMGNCFKTKEEAEKYKLRLQSMAYKPFLPKKHDKYYLALSKMHSEGWWADDFIWQDNGLDVENYLLGRVRRTEEEAEEWITKFSKAWEL